MGTRTYSRRAADGSRRATALGLRTGRFVTETMSAQDMAEYDAIFNEEERAFIRQFAPNPLSPTVFADKNSPLVKRIFAILLSQQDDEDYRQYWQDSFDDPDTQFPALLDEYLIDLRDNALDLNDLAQQLNQFQYALYEALGYNAAPTVSDWDTILSSGADTVATVNGRPMVGWRGFANPEGADYLNEYINGNQMWIGKGIFGNGLYVSIPLPAEKDSDYAQFVENAVSYAKDFSSGWFGWGGGPSVKKEPMMSVFGLRANARTNIPDILAAPLPKGVNFEGNTSARNWTENVMNAFRSLYGFRAPDIGFAAAALGYDAYIAIGNAPSRPPSSSKEIWHLNILNRGAMVVANQSVPTGRVSNQDGRILP